MFGFAHDIPAKKLVGQIVWWACFSEVGAKIEFKNGDRIVLYDLLAFSEDNGVNVESARAMLIGLCHSELSGFIQIDEKHLVICFANGTQLQFKDSDESFENFEFVISGISYIV